MKLGVFSDLHLDHHGWEVTRPEADLYINAGDTTSDDATLQQIEKAFPGIHVMGNHDYYGKHFPLPGAGQKKIEKDGLVFAGCTLWTDLSNPLDWLVYRRGLVDTAHIHPFSQEDMVAAHRSDLRFLMESGADVFVTHHAPTLRSVHPRYENDPHNVCFANDLEEILLFMEKPPKLWIHGHTHDSFDYTVGSTRVICHPRGYPHEASGNYHPLVVEI